MRILSYNNSINSWNLLTSGFSEAKQHLVALFSEKGDYKSFGIRDTGTLDLAARKLTHLILILPYALPLINIVVLMAMYGLQKAFYPTVDLEAAQTEYTKMQNQGVDPNLTPEQKIAAVVGLAHAIEQNGSVVLVPAWLDLFQGLGVEIQHGAPAFPLSLVAICGEHNLPQNVKAIVLQANSNAQSITDFLKTQPAPQSRSNFAMVPGENKAFASFVAKNLRDPVLMALTAKANWADDNTSIEEINQSLSGLSGELFTVQMNHPLDSRAFPRKLQLVAEDTVQCILSDENNSYIITYKEGEEEKSMDVGALLLEKLPAKEAQLKEQYNALSDAYIRTKAAAEILKDEVFLKLPHLVALPDSQAKGREMQRLCYLLQNYHFENMKTYMNTLFTHISISGEKKVALELKGPKALSLKLAANGNHNIEYAARLQFVTNDPEEQIPHTVFVELSGPVDNTATPTILNYRVN